MYVYIYVCVCVHTHIFFCIPILMSEVHGNSTSFDFHASKSYWGLQEAADEAEFLLYLSVRGEQHRESSSEIGELKHTRMG